MAETRNESFGQLLRRLRRNASLTQEDLAERAGMSVRTVSDIERGISTAPYRATIDALADALGVDAEWRRRLHVAGARRRKGPDSVPRSFDGLPAEPNALIGRERDEEEILYMLRFGGARMVTITGAGGVGKTRLALRSAERLQREGVEVHFVALGTVMEPSLVPGRIAGELGLDLEGGEDAAQALVRALRPRNVLLVLDNLEQLASIGPMLAGLLQQAPSLRLLVTSREVLRVRAEREYPLAPLALPSLDHLAGPDVVAAFPAVALFVDRARAVRPDFRVTEENARTVTEICRRLDGLPLAIELAAAWMRSLSPQGLLLRLDRPLRLLRAGPKDLPLRQQTMREAIAWSYSLLAPDESLLFRRLGVFLGGTTLEAAQEVCAEDREDMLMQLDALTAKSLLVASRTDGDVERWSMLETIREFALEEFDASGEGETTRRRLRDYFAALAEQSSEGLVGGGQERWIERLDLERDNLQGAFDWSLSAPGEGAQALMMAADLSLFWQVRGHLEEGSRWFDRALGEAEGLSPEDRATALNCAANVANLRGEYEQARDLYDRALALFREIGDLQRQATVLGNLAVLADWQENVEEADHLYHAAMAAHREAGDGPGVARTALNWAPLVADAGRLDEAETMIEEALRFYEERGDARNIAGALSSLGYAAALRHDDSRALSLHRAAMQRLYETGLYSDLTGELEMVARHHDEPEIAVRVLAVARRMREEMGRPIPPSERAAEHAHLAALRTALGTESFERAWQDGRSMTPDAVVALALGESADLSRSVVQG